jgi:hypothetical protein
MGICEKLQENPDNPKLKFFKKEYKQVYGRDFDPKHLGFIVLNP